MTRQCQHTQGWVGGIDTLPPPKKKTSRTCQRGSLLGAGTISSGKMNVSSTSGLLARSLFRGTDVKKDYVTFF